MTKTIILLFSLLLVLLTPHIGLSLTEKQIDELLNSIPIEFDEATEKELRTRYANWMYSEEFEKLIQNESERSNIINLTSQFGLNNISKLEIVTNGSEFWIKVTGSKAFISDNQYSQKIIYVANNEVGNSILLNKTPPFLTSGNYYTSKENIYNELRCTFKDSQYYNDIQVMDTTCDSMWPLLEKIRTGELSFPENWGSEKFRNEILKTSLIMKEKDTIKIYIDILDKCNNSNYEILLEERNHEYRIVSVFYVTS